MTEKIEFTGGLKLVTVRPGDMFVITVDQATSEETVKKIEEAWTKIWADRQVPKVMVLGDGMKLGVIRREEVDTDENLRLRDNQEELPAEPGQGRHLLHDLRSHGERHLEQRA